MKSRQLTDSQEAERDKQKTEGNIRKDNKKRQQEKKSREIIETNLPYNMVYRIYYSQWLHIIVYT